MSSLWNRSGTIERYADDIRATGAQAFFFQGGTTTPMTVYQDAATSVPWPFPVVADANGRWPDIFIPYITAYDVQVKTADGVQLTYTLGVPNPNPVDVSVTVPLTSTVTTGMIYADFAATRTGFVRLNGKNIGNAASSNASTEYAAGSSSANASIEPLSAYNLFKYLFDNLNNTIAPVSGGRLASAAASFDANKFITLPDMRGASFVGLDTMGNTAAGAFPAGGGFGITFTVGDAVTAGSLTGVNVFTLAVANMPAHSHGGTTGSNGGHTHAITADVSGNFATGITGAESNYHTHAITLGAITLSGVGGSAIAATAATVAETTDHTHGLSGQGGGAANLAGALQANALFQGTQTVGGSHLMANATTSILSTGIQSVHHTHALSGSVSTESAAHNHQIVVDTTNGSFTGRATTATATSGQSLDANTGAHSHSVQTDVQGGTIGPGPGFVHTVQPFNNLGISRLVTWFIKL